MYVAVYLCSRITCKYWTLSTTPAVTLPPIPGSLYGLAMYMNVAIHIQYLLRLLWMITKIMFLFLDTAISDAHQFKIKVFTLIGIMYVCMYVPTYILTYICMYIRTYVRM